MPTATFEDVTVVRTSDEALLLDIEGEEVWVPRSQVIDGALLEPGEQYDIEVKEWWAVEKGLV